MDQFLFNAAETSEDLFASRPAPGTPGGYFDDYVPAVDCPRPDPGTYLSDAIGMYLAYKTARGVDAKTSQSISQDLWGLLWFLLDCRQADCPMRELWTDFAARWLHWLRKTPSYRCDRGSYPEVVSHATVAAWMDNPPPRRMGGPRAGNTQARALRNAKGFFDWAGTIRCDLSKAEKPNTYLPPPLAPPDHVVSQRWRVVLAGQSGKSSPQERRRVVLTQALILLTGMRCEECLFAQRSNVEGHFLLLEIAKRNRPRILYLNAQALGLCEALKCQTVMEWAPDRYQRLAGWPFGLSSYHEMVRECGCSDAKKPQQDLRKQCSTRILLHRHPLARDVEKAQLGHGGDVVHSHYTNYLVAMPEILEELGLPDPGVAGFHWPAPIQASREVPYRLYDRFRRIANDRG